MKEVILSMKEHYKFETIRNCYHNRITKTGASIRLGITLRQVNRLLKHYELHGKQAFVHGNKGKCSNNRIDSDTRYKVAQLYIDKYYGSNTRHFTELLEEHEGIKLSDTTVRSILHINNIFPPRTWKKTIKKVNKPKIINVVDDIEIEINEVDLSVIHPKKERKKYFGEQIQMDASVHLWFGNFKTHLHAAIDNSTGMIVGMYFDKEETLKGYYNVYSQILLNYGIPYEFLTDRRTVFEYKKKASSSIEKDTYTQFTYACKYFGTNVKTTSVPQAKGQIERLFGTLQSRLITELKIRSIDTIEQANAYLPQFISQHNSKFALQYNDNTSAFEEIHNKQDIYNYLSIRYPRIITKGATIKFENKEYYPSIDGKRKYFDHRVKALVFKTLDNKLYVTISDEIYNMDELSIHEVRSRNFDKSIVEKKEKKIYRPPMSHPWKQSTFEKHARKQKHLSDEQLTMMYD